MELSLKAIGLLAAVGGFILACVLTWWQVRLYAELEENRRAIEDKQKAYDAVPEKVAGRTNGHLVNDDQRQKMVAKDLQPIARDIELLKEQRDFIKDKLWFAKK